MSLWNHSYVQYPADTAATILAQEQHAPGVSIRMNPRTFRTEYIRPDGSYVPGYEYYLRAAQQGLVRHDAAGRLIVITQ